MSELKKDQHEKEWADEVNDEDDYPEPYEDLYRDGAAKHECWENDR